MNNYEIEGTYLETEWVSGHEIGHIAGGVHTDVRWMRSDCDNRYTNCLGDEKCVTYMHTPEPSDEEHDHGTCRECDYYAHDADIQRDDYSSCAESSIKDTMDQL